MKGRSASKIKLTSYDELLGGGEETNDIQQVSLEHLHSFENHPFQVNDDEAMAELVESVKEEGILTEGDVYRLITKSRLKSAQNFEKWVFDEVLPAIRKTGGYLETDLLDRVKDNPELLLEFAERLLAENNRNRELQNRVKDMQPKADYYDHFMITGECTNIRTTAKEIEFPERKFVKLLLNRGFLYRSPSGTLLPYAVEKNNDLFIVKDYFNNGHLGSQTLVTPKGKEFFKALCAEEE